jgi:hypothetical protein
VAVILLLPKVIFAKEFPSEFIKSVATVLRASLGLMIWIPAVMQRLINAL